VFPHLFLALHPWLYRRKNLSRSTCGLRVRFHRNRCLSTLVDLLAWWCLYWRNALDFVLQELCLN